MAVGKGKKVDPEIYAINTILGALAELDGESIQRVLDYVMRRLSLPPSHSVATLPLPKSTELAPVDLPPSGRQLSIRDLKEQKKPESANQMAALVAYYLSDVAPQSERMPTITSDEIQKYFKQGGFRLPTVLRAALPNAAAAGYFDAVGNGAYKLNPVGYNLIVHGLPRKDGESGRRPAKRRRRQ